MRTELKVLGILALLSTIVYYLLRVNRIPKNKAILISDFAVPYSQNLECLLRFPKRAAYDGCGLALGPGFNSVSTGVSKTKDGVMYIEALPTDSFYFNLYGKIFFKEEQISING